MIYITIYDLLKAKISALPQFKSIDWFNNQYQNTEKETAEAYPACYIEIQDPVTWKNASAKMQSGTVKFMLHVVVNNLKTEPHATLILAQDLFVALHSVRLIDGAGNQISGEMTRNFTELPTRYRQLKVCKIGFECEVFDISAMEQGVLTSTAFSINTSFQA